MAELKKKKKQGFKWCASYPAIFLGSSDHIRCLKCLGEGHSPSGFSVFQTFTSRAFMERQNRLQVLLLKKALEAKPAESGHLSDPRFETSFRSCDFFQQVEAVSNCQEVRALIGLGSRSCSLSSQVFDVTVDGEGQTTYD